MIRERIARNTSPKNGCVVTAFSKGTADELASAVVKVVHAVSHIQVVDPVVITVAVIKEFLDILSPVSIKPFQPPCWKTHNNELVCNIDEVQVQVELFILEPSFASRDKLSDL